MKRIYLLFAIIVLTTPTVKAQTALEFSNKMADITDSLYAKGSAWGTAFSTARQTGNYTTLKPIREGMQEFIDKYILLVQKMKDVNNSKELRMAMIDLLKIEKQLTDSFRPFEAFNASTPAEKVQAELDTLTSKAKVEASYMDKANTAQAKYAAENNFKIED